MDLYIILTKPVNYYDRRGILFLLGLIWVPPHLQKRLFNKYLKLFTLVDSISHEIESNVKNLHYRETRYHVRGPAKRARIGFTTFFIRIEASTLDNPIARHLERSRRINSTSLISNRCLTSCNIASDSRMQSSQHGSVNLSYRDCQLMTTTIFPTLRTSG